MLSAQLVVMYREHVKDFTQKTPDEKKLSLKKPANNEQLLMPVIFAIRSGMSLLKIKETIIDDESVIEQAEKYIADVRLEKLNLYFKIKETCKQQSEEQLIFLIACFIQQMGSLQELKNALGAHFKKDLVERAIAKAKQSSASLITINENSAKNLDFIIKEFQSSLLNDKASSLEENNKTRESYISILIDLKKSYDAANNVYNKEIEVEHTRYRRQFDDWKSPGPMPMVYEIREGVTFKNMSAAHEKFHSAYQDHIFKMIKTIKEVRKTYPKDAKEPITSEFLYTHLPIGTALGWIQKAYKTKKAPPNLLNMKQIEEDLDAWLKTTHAV